MDSEDKPDVDEQELQTTGEIPSDAPDPEAASEVVVTEEHVSGEPVEPEVADVADVAPAASTSEAESADTQEDDADPSEPLKIKKPEVEEDDVVLGPEDAPKDWYILKVSFNREESVREALLKQIKISGLDGYFGEVLVPTEDIVEFTRSGKRKIVKRKLYPGYLMVFMHVNDDTWFLVRETNGVSDFTGTAGKPAPMDPVEVERVIKVAEEDDEGEKPLKTSIPFKVGERVRVKEGNFQNQEGEVEKLDEANGRISVNINIFGRTVPVELDHWQVEPL